MAPNSMEEITSDARQQVVPLERARLDELIDQLQCGVRARGHGDRDSSVQLDDRGRGGTCELAVERDHLVPVGVLGTKGTGVAGGDRRLQRVGAAGLPELFGPGESVFAASDVETVPCTAILIQEQDGRARGCSAGTQT
jgi:hypothetical protein